MIAIVITLILVGILIYLEEKYLPLPPWIRIAIRWVVGICVAFWLLHAFGVLPLRDIPVPKLNN